MVSELFALSDLGLIVFLSSDRKMTKAISPKTASVPATVKTMVKTSIR